MRFLCGINTGKTKRGFRQRVQRERMKYSRLGREGENVSGGRESGMGLNRGQHLVGQINTKYFWISQIAISTQRLF
jgi:hypothetical protein